MNETMTWLAETCDLAIKEAQEGNTALINRLGKDGGFAYYLNNVHTRKVMSPEQFASQFPNLVKDLTTVKEQYELVTKQPVQDARLQTVEQGLEALKEMVAKLLEAQEKPEPVERPAKKAKKVETETESETTDESAESEA